jgi:hypothetical protein
MYATLVDPINAIVFSPVRPPRGFEPFHGPARAVTSIEPALESPEYWELFRWPDGAPAPDVVVCEVIDDPGRFVIVKYRDEVSAGFRVLDRC